MPSSTPAVEVAAEVNQEELAEILTVSVVTLRKIIKKNSDFPVIEGGSKGVPYKFDPAAVAVWWRANDAKVAEEAAARTDELQQWRIDLFGGDISDAEKEKLKLSGRARIEEYKAQLAEIELRRVMGRLVEAAAVEAKLASATVDLRNALLRIPGAFAKQYALDRELRLDLEDRIIAVLTRLADELGRSDADRASAA